MCLPAAGTCTDRSDATLVPDEDLAICGYNQRNAPDKTCIVDGDTLWLNGTNIRLKDFDTPESHADFCGGFGETNLCQIGDGPATGAAEQQ